MITDIDGGFMACPSTGGDSLNSSLLGKHSKQRFLKGAGHAI